MEPKALNTLAKEADELRTNTLETFSGSLPDSIAYIFNDTSEFFEQEVLVIWRMSERFDELIDYILYQYGEQGGEELWKQVLLDLRLKNDDDRALTLLEGLAPGREERLAEAVKAANRNPNNYIAATSLQVAKGEIMKILYEIAFLLENKQPGQRNEQKISEIKHKVISLLDQ